MAGSPYNTLLRPLLLFTGLMSPPLWGDDIQPLESIRKAAERHIVQREAEYPAPPKVEAGRLDSRLRLAPCNRPLETFSPPGGRDWGKITVGVRCGGAKPWSLYVPVTVTVMTEVVVMARDLPRGSPLGPDDIKLEKRDLARLNRGYLQDPAEVLGKTLKRDLRRNQVLTPSRIAARKVVRQGSRVTILATTGGIEVRMRGKALSSGALGERIQVRNESSKREIAATVVSAGVVRVTM